MAYYMTKAQAGELDPTWDYENEAGELGWDAGWYFWPQTCEYPKGPYRSLKEAEMVERGWMIIPAITECLDLE